MTIQDQCAHTTDNVQAGLERCLANAVQDGVDSLTVGELVAILLESIVAVVDEDDMFGTGGKGSLSSVETVPMTWAPRRWANWVARRPTPPAVAWITIQSPFWTMYPLRTWPTAVRPCMLLKIDETQKRR